MTNAYADIAAGANNTGERPRIGLSLGGGGARGLAHIGVLRVLEEKRIPVDLIAGTSMGAIDGSLYALGMTADEFEALILAIDWEDIFTDRIQRQVRSFRRKEDNPAYLFGFEFGLSTSGPVLPHSIARGQNLAFALPVPELHTEGHRSFDDLPIPFRAVATDVETGEAVILDHGNLFRAVRASMTVPLAFPPVLVNGRFLVDGGLTINNPVQVVRGMGAGAVLAISVDQLPEDHRHDDLVYIKQYIYQLLAITLKPQVQEELAHAEVAVRVRLQDMNMDEFTRGAEAIAAGEAAAREAAAQLSAYSLSPEEYAAWRQSTRRRPTPEWRFEDVEIVNRTRVADAFLQRNLRPLSEDGVDLEAVRHTLEQIYDVGILEPLKFDIDDAQGGSRLRVTATEKRYAPRVLHFGVSGRTTVRGNTQFSILTRLTRFEINDWGAEWRSQLALGTDTTIDTEFYQPLGIDRYLFLSLRGSLGETRQDVYENSIRTGVQLFRQAYVVADLGAPLGAFGEIRSGLLWGGLKSSIDTGESSLESFDGGQGSWETSLRYDMLDAPDFPHSGGLGAITMRVSHPRLGARDTFTKALVTWTEYATVARWTSFASIAGGSSFNSGLPPQEQFLLGGFSSFAGYSSDEFRGDVLGTLRLGAYLSLNRPHDILGTKWYAGLWGDVGNVWPSSGAVDFASLRTGGAAFLGADSIVGPVFLTGGWASGGDTNLYVTLGKQVDLSQ